MTIRLVVVIASSLIAAAPAAAHHSVSAMYHVDRVLVLDGVVADFRFVNPHVRLYLDVTGDGGEVEQWLVEGGTPMVLRRFGWTGEEIKAGDRVQVRGNPGRDDDARIFRVLRITLADGVEMSTEDFDFEAVDRRRREP